MNKFVAGHVTKMLFLNLWISFWTQAFHLHFKEDVEKMCGNVYSKSEHNYQMFNKI